MDVRDDAATRLHRFAVKTFPWRRRGVQVPTGDRRTAALGVCLFTASQRVPLGVQLASFWATRLLGTRALPGRATPWTAPVEPAAWADLVAAWVAVLGPVDAMALYQRRQSLRGGVTMLLTRAGAPVAVVKLRDDGVSLHREQQALRAIEETRPTSFSAARALGAGTDGTLHWSAQEAVFTRPHRPVLSAPAGLFDDVRRCLEGLADLPPPAPGVELAHHDLTPWNLRRDHRGRVWLYDWEDWAAAPAGADRSYFSACAHALTGQPMPSGLSPLALQHWRGIVTARGSDNPADAALMAGILEGLDGAPEMASDPGRHV